MSSLDPSPPVTGPDDVPPSAATKDAGPSLARATVAMSIGTALSRVTGFGRIAVMAWAIGATESKLPDTYNLANSLPNIVYQLVLGEILATIFVPVFVEHIKTREREDSWKLASSILNIAFVVYGRQTQWDQFWASNGTQFHSLGEVIRYDPIAFMRGVIANLGTHWMHDSRVLLPLWLGLPAEPPDIDERKEKAPPSRGVTRGPKRPS